MAMINVYHDEYDLPDALDERGLLRDGHKLRHSVLLKDAAPNGVCSDCNGRGRWVDVGIRCPMCGGTGFTTNGNGGVEGAVRNTSTHHESSGLSPAAANSDRASLSDHDRYVLADREARAKAAPHRPGYRIIDNGAVRASQQKLADACAAHERYITTAYRGADIGASMTSKVPADVYTGAGSQARNIGVQREGSPCMTAEKKPVHCVAPLQAIWSAL